MNKEENKQDNESNLKKSKIKHFKNVLYSRKNKFSDYERRKLSSNKEEINLNQNWQGIEDKFEEDTETNSKKSQKKNKNISFFSVLLVFSIIFFLGAIFYSYFYLISDQNTVNNKLEMSITGPNTVNSGSAFEFIVDLKNNSKNKFENISISIDFPESTKLVATKEIINKDLIKIEEKLLAGENIDEKFNVILTGVKGEQKNIKISTFYNIVGQSNSRSVIKIYQIGIDSSPVSLGIIYPEKTLSTEEFTLDLNINSNTNIDFKELLLIANLPQGFTATSFSTEPIFSNESIVIFKTGKLAAGEKINFKINGNLSGEQGSKKIFSFEVGDVDPLQNIIRTLFAKSEKGILIKKPDLQFDVVITNKNKSNYDNKYIVQAGDSLEIKLNLKNNLDSIISDLKIEAFLEGESYNPHKLRIKKGHFNSNKEIITWNKNTWNNLSALGSKEKISDEITIEIKDLEALAGFYTNPDLKINFKVSGVNFNTNILDGKVLSEFSLNIKVATDLVIESDIFYSIGPFENTGPIQPTIGKTTTYTAVWMLSNSTNLLEDLEVRAKLPFYVDFLDNISPENYYLSFDPESREIIWRLKRLAEHTGHRNAPEKVYFQIAITPSAHQIGKKLNLVGPKTVVATDTFIENQIFTNQTKSDNTEIKNDPLFEFNIGSVVME